ncbi:MAG: hypothetical protein PHH62_06920 [Endomicrobiaceae bacterium]|nr:hypothetical protein [Endomicrobiaceae bacterium]MDD5102693.1 hypothetical protein [Endomicrobiaceae bacterium]
MVIEKPLDQLFFDSKLGKYEIVKLAIEWIKVRKSDEDYRKLSQPQLLDKAVRDVLTGEATYEKIADIEKKKSVKEEKQENHGK